jgi:membrane peptidoglycan carboxypeptidase
LLVGTAAYAYVRKDLPAVEEFGRDPLPLATQIYARDGTTLLFEFAEERREATRLEEVPRSIIDATIAAEDKSFWTNPGVDLGGIARAAVRNILQRDGDERPQGASTITQQLVKQRLVGSELSLTRKVKEAILAVEVSRHYSKEQVLELYLNQIYYGNRAYGLKAAARAYFGTTDLSTLTLAQSALLAGLPQAPSILDPSKPENQERAKDRRSYVLAQMVETGAITEEDRSRAEAEPIALKAAPPTNIRAPHFVFRVKDELARIVGGEAQVMRGGYRVVTTLDWPKQEEAERQVARWVQELRARNVGNAALVSIDPRTGEVLAYVGSVDYRSDDAKAQGKFDVAGFGERQPGSAFKLFTYLTALQRGATPATVVVDARTDFSGYRPENADLEYHGPLTMRQAIRESRNVPAVKFLQHYAGIEETIKTAQALGLTANFERANAGLSLTLGSVPVTLVEMTGAFGAVATLGERIPPRLIAEIRDPNGNVVPVGEPRKERVLSPEVAWLMTDMLKDTTDPSRSHVFGSWTNIGRPAALKTGTTDDLKDVYSVGYTPQLVTGVWMGNSDGSAMNAQGFFSAMGPGQLWRDYMKTVLTNVPVEDWPRPAGIVAADVVVAPGALGGYGSGLLPSRATPWSSTELFVRGSAPNRPDDWFEEPCSAAATAGARPRGAVMVVKEAGPEGWRRDRETWVREAMAGRHNYGRFPWSSMLSRGEPCPTPSPTPSPTASPVPSPTPAPTPTPRMTPTATPTRTPPPTPRGTGTPRP